MNNKFHPFHMVKMSMWPILTAMSVMFMVMSITQWTMTKNPTTILMTTVTTMMMSFMWWKDTSREPQSQGFHTTMVMKGIKMGMVMFILSEVMFFVSFFWSYFHSSISPTMEIGQEWPPTGIEAFNPMNVPLLNTMILLTSGVSATWAHHEMLKNKLDKAMKANFMTVTLGVYFSMVQFLEYKQSEFTISESTYGSTFFMATGFHGIHVLVGTTFLTVCMMRMMKMGINSEHMTGFEMASWYWHFVDVVWLMLYLSVYWWGK